MAQILVRNIEEEVKVKLKKRAHRHGRSLEAELREILRDAAKNDSGKRKGLGTEIASLFRNIGLKPGEEFQELRGFKIEPAKFDE